MAHTFELVSAGLRHATLHRPGRPAQNAFIESFNGSFRDECLNTSWFMSLEDARRIVEEWRRDYNEVRPHSSLGGRTPAEYAAAASAARETAAGYAHFRNPQRDDYY